jgi:hypothetical protein
MEGPLAKLNCGVPLVLYAIEKEIRSRSVEERRAIRQAKSRPILDDLEPWLRARLDQSKDKARPSKYAVDGNIAELL